MVTELAIFFCQTLGQARFLLLVVSYSLSARPIFFNIFLEFALQFVLNSLHANMHA
jgi:hypothetical protein